MRIEHAVLWVRRLAPRRELLKPHAEGAPRLLARQERRLVEQRYAAPLAAKLVVMVQELLPLGPAGRSWVDAERRSLPAIGEQRFYIARNGVAYARQIAAVAGLGLIGDAEVAILVENVEEAAFAERPHAEQIFVRPGIALVVDDLGVRPGRVAAHDEDERLTQQEEVQLVGIRAQLAIARRPLDPQRDGGPIFAPEAVAVDPAIPRSRLSLGIVLAQFDQHA